MGLGAAPPSASGYMILLLLIGVHIFCAFYKSTAA